MDLRRSVPGIGAFHHWVRGPVNSRTLVLELRLSRLAKDVGVCNCTDNPNPNLPTRQPVRDRLTVLIRDNDPTLNECCLPGTQNSKVCFRRYGSVFNFICDEDCRANHDVVCWCLPTVPNCHHALSVGGAEVFYDRLFSVDVGTQLPFVRLACLVKSVIRCLQGCTSQVILSFEVEQRGPGCDRSNPAAKCTDPFPGAADDFILFPDWAYGIHFWPSPSDRQRCYRAERKVNRRAPARIVLIIPHERMRSTSLLSLASGISISAVLTGKRKKLATEFLQEAAGVSHLLVERRNLGQVHSTLVAILQISIDVTIAILERIERFF